MLNLITVLLIVMIQVSTLYNGDHVLELVKSIPFDQSLRLVFSLINAYNIDK